VAKGWGEGRSLAELERLRLFYADLSRAELTFATPYIERLLVVEGRCVSIERRLTGTPLADVEPRRPDRRPAAVECVVDVLEQLRSVADTPALRGLAVIGEERPFWEGRASWADALSGLIVRKVDRFGEQLRAAVPGFDGMLGRLLESIAALPGTRLSVMHGDMVPANILVDERLRPVGVLDFGFLSTAGDPVFDAAVTASIFDMYGPLARDTERDLDKAIIERFDYSAARMALYRAAYGVISSNAYDPLGQDGHFRWCADILRREDVRELLGTPVSARTLE